MASNANEPVPWVPKRPLCEIGTKCHWQSHKGFLLLLRFRFMVWAFSFSFSLGVLGLARGFFFGCKVFKAFGVYKGSLTPTPGG